MSRLTPAGLVAGSPVAVEVDTAGPTQPWLGMPGHLVVRSEDGVQMAHAHGTAAGQSVLRSRSRNGGAIWPGSSTPKVTGS